MSTNSFIYKGNIVSNMSEIIDITDTVLDEANWYNGVINFTCRCGETITVSCDVTEVCSCGGIYGVSLRLYRNDVNMRK